MSVDVPLMTETEMSHSSGIPAFEENPVSNDSVGCICNKSSSHPDRGRSEISPTLGGLTLTLALVVLHLRTRRDRSWVYLG